MYDNLSDEPDEYKKDLFSAIEQIEKYLKPKLSHEKVSYGVSPDKIP